MNIGLVFGIIFSAIVVGFAFALGGGQISSFFCISGVSQLEQHMADLGNKVDVAYNLGRGSILDFEYTVPEDSKLCFIDPANPAKNIYMGWDPDFETQYFLENPDNQYYGSNVWYFYCNDLNAMKITKLQTKENFCVSGQGTLLLENLGRSVEISRE